MHVCSIIRTSKNSVFNKLKLGCQNLYKEKIGENGKIKLYNKLKFNVTRERYLQYPDPVIQREVVTEICISCHELPIEQRRYNNVPIFFFKKRLCN